ncbi:uncharacterized protein A4U43_C01F4380 [Asparagus officinalis]|uniref:HMA domain-containing protein n=1 Tax=Asparagus officinalis TaxID=4686 RepID=A0A5P1FND9_ASPOF|nr:uncharacterized protein A4U43_C01F4380 [Asparagus officinalis]
MSAGPRYSGRSVRRSTISRLSSSFGRTTLVRRGSVEGSSGSADARRGPARCGCEARIRKSLAKLRGVDTVDIDMPLQKVTVTGYADQKKVLKAVRKSAEERCSGPATSPKLRRDHRPSALQS